MGTTDDLLNFGNFHEIKGDGLGDVHFRGKAVQIYLFGWRRIDGVWRRVTTGWAEVPQEAIPAENLERLRLVYPHPEETARAH